MMLVTSPPFSAEVKNEWSHDSVPPVSLNGMDMDSFTFYFILPSTVVRKPCFHAVKYNN
jgi:hypothetical protein